MYKTKLQELCHQQSWNLPEYAVVKDGPDHMPRFTGTVSVNGRPFQTPSPCRSSKEAQNEAARVAFVHFSAPRAPPKEPNRVAPPPPLPPPSGDGGDDAAGMRASSLNNILASLETVQPRLPNRNEISKVAESQSLANFEKVQQKPPESDEFSKAAEGSSTVNDNTTVKDVQHLYKNQLQTFAQKRNVGLPIYSSEHEGPPHARRFRCQVSIDGRTYQTGKFYNTLKEAEHAAAKNALMSLSSDTVQEVDCGLYKSILQEFTQKHHYRLPTYDTVKCGESHIPFFISTVEIEEERFTGQEARTKKMAETGAAKVAYTILKERTFGKKGLSSSSQSPMLQKEKAAMLSYCSQVDDTTGYQQNVASGPISNVISNQSGSHRKQFDDDEGGQEHKKDGLDIDDGHEDEIVPEQDKEEEAVGSNEESPQTKKRKA